MNGSKITHGICIGDTWLRNDSTVTCTITNISITCGGNALVFFNESIGGKFIEFADNFSEHYTFYSKGI